MTDRDIVFIDTETLGLDPSAPIWEFAAVRRFENGNTDRTEFFIRHQPEPWATQFKTEAPALYEDYAARYNVTDALDEQSAAYMIHMVTRYAVVIGCNPSFDTERLASLLRRNGIEPAWHYRPVCVSTLAYGWLNGVAARAVDESLMIGETPDPELVHREQTLPWSSDEVSRALGVDPDQYARHTALGDVLWTIAQYDKIMGTEATT